MKFWTCVGAMLVLVTAAFAAGHSDSYAKSLPAPPADDIIVSGDLDNKPSTRGTENETVLIGIDSRPIFYIRTPAAGFTVSERERIVYMRLVEVISYTNVDDPGIYSIRSVRGKPTIYIGPYRFITVYQRDAAAENVDAMSLAKSWKSSLQTVLPDVAPWAVVAPTASP